MRQLESIEEMDRKLTELKYSIANFNYYLDNSDSVDAVTASKKVNGLLLVLAGCNNGLKSLAKYYSHYPTDFNKVKVLIKDWENTTYALDAVSSRILELSLATED